MLINQRGNILVVEDESIVALDLKKCLQKMGYHVLQVVSSGEKSIDIVKKEKPDLVLMDIWLKGKMDGIEAARLIHSQFDIPVVYLTAFADDQTLNQATASEPYGYLVKPYDARELKTTIEVAIFKHKMQRELKESQERFRQIFEQNFDAIVLIKRENFEVIDLNSEALVLFQFSKEELRRDFSIVFKDYSSYKVFQRELANYHITNSEFFLDRCRLKKKDNTEIICSIRANELKIHRDKIIYCSFRDITDKVNIEEETRLLQSKLIQTNKMTSLGTLASGIAHEINNPNNFIMTNTQIFQQIWNSSVEIFQEYYEKKGEFPIGGLKYTEAKEIVPKLLQDTIEGSRRIKYITENLREYSRPKDMEALTRVSINKVLEFSISILNNQIKKYTDCFIFEPGENIPLFYGNFQQIEQVIINLVQNALQSLPDKSHSVKINSFFDRVSQSIVVKVSDTGVGMNPKILSRISDPFFSTKQDQGGTGLGLYISYSIIKSHNGTMDFDSEPGRGTTVTLQIPVDLKA